MSRFIVGGGISALIFKYYNPEYKIISSNIGGQLTDPWLGPRLLNDTRENRKLLGDLCFPIKKEICKIGYLIKGNVYPHCTEIARSLYYKKSRCLSKKAIVPESCMSSGSNTIEHLQIGWKDLVEKLTPSSEDIISEDVKEITETHVNGERYHRLVWTPSLKILLKLLKIDQLDLIAHHKFFTKTTEAPFDMTDYDYIYAPQRRYAYHRVTKWEGNYIFEFTKPDPEYIPPELPGTVDSKKLLNIQLVPFNRNQIKTVLPQNIKLLGRFAEWDHGIKIEDVVRASLRHAAQK